MTSDSNPEQNPEPTGRLTLQVRQSTITALRVAAARRGGKGWVSKTAEEAIRDMLGLDEGLGGEKRDQ